MNPLHRKKQSNVTIGYNIAENLFRKTTDPGKHQETCQLPTRYINGKEKKVTREMQIPISNQMLWGLNVYYTWDRKPNVNKQTLVSAESIAHNTWDSHKKNLPLLKMRLQKIFKLYVKINHNAKQVNKCENLYLKTRNKNGVNMTIRY